MPPSTSANALAIGKGTFVSRLFGFARDAAIAALLGGGGAADAFLLAFRLPNTVRQIAAEGAPAYVLIPAYREKKLAGGGGALLFTRSLAAALFALCAILALGGFIFSEPLSLLLGPGFFGTPVRGPAASFFGLCLFSLPFTAGAAVFSAALMAEGAFRPAAYSSAVFNACVILFAGIAFAFVKGGPAAPYVLCGGVIAGGAAQWISQARALGRMGFSPFGPISLPAAETASALRAVGRSFCGLGGHQANMLLAAALASFLAEGGVSALYFAERIIAFPLGLIGASVGLAALPELAAAAPRTGPCENGGGTSLFSSRLRAATRAALFLALPAAAGAACLADPIAAAVFGRGSFGADDIARTGGALLACAAGLPALALIRPLLAATGALRDTAAPVRAAFAGLAATLCAGTLLLITGTSWGPALAVSAGACVNAWVLLRALARRGVSCLPESGWIIRALLAVGVMAMCAVGWASLFSPAAAKLTAVPLGVVVYWLAAFLLRMEEAAFFVRMIKAG